MSWETFWRMIALTAADQTDQVGGGGANSGFDLPKWISQDGRTQRESVVRTPLYTSHRWLTNTDVRGSSLLRRER